jgi:hypothetical protein
MIDPTGYRTERTLIGWNTTDGMRECVAQLAASGEHETSMGHAPYDRVCATSILARRLETSQSDKGTRDKSDHVLHSCLCPANALGREQMTHHMHSSIRSLEVEGELSPDRCWFLKQLFGLTIDGSTDTWTRGEEPQWTQWAQQQPIHADAKGDIQSWVRNGSECNWKGLFPPRLSI